MIHEIIPGQEVYALIIKTAFAMMTRLLLLLRLISLGMHTNNVKNSQRYCCISTRSNCQ